MALIINIAGTAAVILFIVRATTFYYIYFRSETNDLSPRNNDMNIGIRTQYLFAGLFIKTGTTGRYSRLGKLADASLKLFYISTVVSLAVSLITVMI